MSLSTVKDPLQQTGFMLCSLALSGWLLAACRSEERAAPAAPAPKNERAQAAWPRWPKNAAEAAALTAQATRRAPRANAPQQAADALLARLRGDSREGRLVVGWDAIVAFLQAQLDAAVSGGHSGFLLWGSHHDAASQVEAFRRLLGPLGLHDLTLATAETFVADGRWSGVEGACQAGDDGVLEAYRARGERRELAALRDAQVAHDYTAWKHGFIDEVVMLAADARAGGVRLLGCELSPCLAQRLSSLDGEQSLRLRELHCALALRDALDADADAAPARVLMLWGEAHVGEEGMQRYLDPGAVVTRVALLGGRASPSAVERELAQKLALTEPVLLPAAQPSEAHTLLLPDAGTGARAERAHDGQSAPLADAERGLWLWSHAPSTVELGAVSIDVGSARVKAPAAPGRRSFVVVRGDRLLVGSVDVPEDGSAELELDPAARRVVTTLRTRVRPP